MTHACHSLRVLVVEDSLTVRMFLGEVLADAPGFDVVGLAQDGKQAIEMCQELRPDVISMDMMMPVMSGLAATEYIMAYCPTPILVVSSSVNRGELFRTYEALSAGAVDVIEKPKPRQEGWEQAYLAQLRLVARVKVITHLRGRKPFAPAPASIPVPALPPAPVAPCFPPPAGATARRGGAAPQLVAIGASTGGPRALVDVLGALPADFPLPLLVVIHIADPFGASFADWLDGQIALPVRLVGNGERLPERGVVMAAPGRHMLLSGGRLVCDDGPELHSCRPSVDALFESLARECGAAAAVLLTGMGQDGARGMLALHRAGAVTIAQDEATSVVYGMPREAAMLGAAQRILPLQEIGPALAAMVPAAPSPSSPPGGAP